jgi:hypothetical protein
MWPYNYCEWKTITYGIKKVKKNNVILLSALPSVILIGLLLFLI